MKKMLLGIAILLILLAASLYNVHYLRGKIDGLVELVDTAALQAENGDFDQAADTVRQAMDRWEAMGGYTHIFIRHAESDSTSDAFCDYLGDLCAGDNGSAQGSSLRLKSHLLSLVAMEQVSLGSIF